MYVELVYWAFIALSPPPGVLGCSLVLSIQAMYSSSDDVVELTPSNFNREVIQSDSLWLVEFYAPWWVRAAVVDIYSELTGVTRSGTVVTQWSLYYIHPMLIDVRKWSMNLCYHRYRQEARTHTHLVTNIISWIVCSCMFPDMNWTKPGLGNLHWVYIHESDHKVLYSSGPAVASEYVHS